MTSTPDLKHSAEDIAAARERTLQRVTTLRTAAQELRDGTRTIDHAQLIDIVADWIDGEAQTLGESEPFLDLINATISADGKPKSLLRLSREENGDIRYASDTSNHAIRLINNTDQVKALNHE